MSDKENNIIVREAGQLPIAFGNTAYRRLLKVYNKLYFRKYGVLCRVSIPTFNKVMKSLLVENNECQIAILMFTFFHWCGITESDEMAQKWLYDKGFPPYLIPYKMNEMITYLTVKRGVCYDDITSVEKYLVETFKKNDLL